MDKNKTFYFFTANEFVCRQSRNLLKDEILMDQNYSCYAITVNLVEFKSANNVKVYKIYLNFSEIGLQADEMIIFYKQVEDYVKLNFIGDDENKIFLGCVRDDNNTHELLTFENLGFCNRTDPIHDIFNVLKNIYNDNRLFYNEDINSRRKWNLVVNLCNMYRCLDALSRSVQDISILNVANNYPIGQKNRKENARRIWIPYNDSKFENYLEPFRYLFNINYYEKLRAEIEKEEEYIANRDVSNRATLLLNFIITLKNLLNFLNEEITPENIEQYKYYLFELSKFDFDNNSIRCLKSLKNSIEANLNFFEKYDTSFKPIWFSTQMIEAEKGYLRYQSCNALPSTNQCNKWFQKALKGKIDKVGYSEFGGCHIKFDPLPDQIEPMIAKGLNVFGGFEETLQCNDADAMEI